jgi:hypothetical protein
MSADILLVQLKGFYCDDVMVVVVMVTAVEVIRQLLSSQF